MKTKILPALLFLFLSMNVYSQSENGYANISEAGYFMGASRSSVGGFGINSSLGYLVNKKIYVGIGAGYEFYPDRGGFVPFFLDTRFFISKLKTTPFLFGKIGASKLASGELYHSTLAPYANILQEGGMMFNIGAGIKREISDKVDFSFSIGYKRQLFAGTTYYDSINNGSFYSYSWRFEDYNEALSLKIGLIFR